MALKLIGQDENIDELMSKYLIRPREAKCIKCKRDDLVFNKVEYIKGYIMFKVEHGCPKKYHMSVCVPITEEEKRFWANT